MKKRLILVGCSASGKDHARKICQDILGMPYQVSYTTRPPREGEADGRDYYFLTEEQFIEKIDADEWYEFVVFNGWYYGTTKEQFYTQAAVFIMTPSGLSHLSPQDREESLVVYLDIEEHVRRFRMEQRQGNADSVERRILADRADFENFKDYDFRIIDHDYNESDIIELVRRYMATNLIACAQN